MSLPPAAFHKRERFGPTEPGAGILAHQLGAEPLLEQIAFDAIRTVFFDAGGVLIDVDLRYVKRLVDAKRIEVSLEQLQQAEALARTEVHQRVQAGGRVGDGWRDYFHSILSRVGVPQAEQSIMIDALWEAHTRFGLWTAPFQDALDLTATLKQRGYQLAVISNAEGRVEKDLYGAGFTDRFECVVDSHVVGVEKPDPAIFELTLSRVGAKVEQTLYIGDVPSVDVEGAKRAGLQPILLDRAGLYEALPVPRIRGLSELLTYLPPLKA